MDRGAYPKMKVLTCTGILSIAKKQAISKQYEDRGRFGQNSNPSAPGQKGILSVENYSYWLANFIFFYGHNMFNGGCKCRNHIIFADGFYRKILSDHFHSMKSVVFLPLRDILGKQKCMRLSRGSKSSNVQVMRQSNVVCFMLVFVFFLFVSLLTTWRRSKLLSECYHLNEERALQLCLTLLGFQNRADHYWARVRIINFWQHEAKLGFWQHNIKWVKHKIKHKKA